MSTFPDELEPWRVAALNRYAQSVTGGDLFSEPPEEPDDDEEPDEE